MKTLVLILALVLSIATVSRAQSSQPVPAVSATYDQNSAGGERMFFSPGHALGVGTVGFGASA
jgi:hypothetical protein